MDISTFLLPQFLPTSSVICYNHFGWQHLFISLISHTTLLIYRKIIKERRNNIETYKNEEYQYNDAGSNTLFHHYILIWLSIITSPKGWQLDIWLCILVFMDCAPIFISIFNTIQYCIHHRYNNIDDPNLAVLRMTAFMRRWSPAYQLNNWIMHYVEGCLLKHIYILFFVTMGVTQLHRLFVSNVYCTRL